MDMVRAITKGDFEAVCQIYNYYIEHTIISFEEELITVEDMVGRIQMSTPEYPWLVYESDGQILGYAYASEWKGRSGYARTAETTIYLAHGAERQGIGSKLYTHLLNMLRDMKMHAVIGGIALPNEASQSLHEKFGYQKVAHFKEVGYKFGKWIDVGYWELIFRD